MSLTLETCCEANKIALACHQRQIDAIADGLHCDCGSYVGSKTIHHRYCAFVNTKWETTHGPVSGLYQPMITWLPCRDCAECAERMKPVG